jgi:hypothetical protein
MSYRVQGSSKAGGIDADAVQLAFIAFVRALDAATDAAGQDGTLFDGSIVGGDWAGDDEPEVHSFSLTADEARHRTES